MIEENPRKLQGEMKLFLQFPGGGYNWSTKEGE